MQHLNSLTPMKAPSVDPMLILLIVCVTAAACATAHGQMPVLASFSHNGELVCTDVLPSTLAAGRAPLNCKWRKDGAALAQGTHATLTLTNLQGSNAGLYTLVGSNPYGSVTSEPALLTVTSPARTYNPASEFSATNGSPNGVWSYGWMQVGFVGPFNLFTNDSAPALPSGSPVWSGWLGVDGTPLIWKNTSVNPVFGIPTNMLSLHPGPGTEPALLRWTAPEDGNVRVQGRFERGDWGTMQVAVRLAGQQWWMAFDWGIFDLQTNVCAGTVIDFAVYGGYGSGSTPIDAVLTFTPAPAPSIYAQPQSQTVASGWTATFSVDACGALPLRFQWRKDGFNLVDGGNISGATTASLLVSNVQYVDAGNYSVVVSNFAGWVASSNALLDFGRLDLAQAVDATNLVWTTGGEASWFVQADVTHDGIDAAQASIGGGSWLETSVSSPGTLSFWWKVSSRETTSVLAFLVGGREQAILEGNSAWMPYIYLHPGGSQRFTWAHGNIGPGFMPGFGEWDAGWLDQVSFTPAVPPTIRAHPQSQTVPAGADLIFNVSATGTGPLSFQWRKSTVNLPNGGRITGATTPTLAVLDAQVNDRGMYSVVVSNAFGVVTSAVAMLTVTSSDPLDHWTWRNPQPQGNDLCEIAFGNGVWVAAGNDGTQVSSHDGGLTWQNRSQGSVEIGGLAFGLGTFVLVGYEVFEGSIPRVQTSFDGVVWTDCSLPANLTNASLFDVTFGNGRFVAVGSYGSMVSTNGTDWVWQGFNNTMRRVTYGNGLFVAVANWSVNTPQGPTGYVAVSADGLNWTNHPLGVPSWLTDITFGNGRFVATSAYSFSNVLHIASLLSTNAISWTSHAIDLTVMPESVTFGNGQFVAVGGNNNSFVACSSDGMNWTTQAIPQTDGPLGVGYGGGSFTMVGDNGNITTSADGVNWTGRSAGSDTNLRSITQGNGLCIAVGNDGLCFTSLDGLTWSRQAPPVTNNLRSVTWGNNLFVAVGEPSSQDGTLLTSTNGRVWTRITGATTRGLYSTASGNGLFVAVGDSGQILTSPDGAIWTQRYLGGNRLNSVTYGGGMFLAVGRNGTIVTSSNGVTWIPRNSGTNSYLQAVAYGNGVFVAAGQSAALLTSSNAVNWLPQAWPKFGDIEDLTFDIGVFMGVGARGVVATSTDGVHWILHTTGCQNDLRSVIYADHFFLAAGNNETILRAGLLAPPTGLRVSKGAYTNLIRLDWNSVDNAISYQVWRGTSPNLGSALLTVRTSETYFLDGQVTAGVTYWYAVKAVQGVRTSVFSLADSGYAPIQPAAPAAVAASDGTAVNNVRITWAAVPGAALYETWRSTTSQTATATRLGTTTETWWDDPVPSGITPINCWYWVKTLTSSFSVPDTGYPMPLPATLGTPRGLRVSEGLLNQITISWEGVPVATNYQLWRSTNSNFADAILVAMTDRTTLCGHQFPGRANSQLSILGASHRSGIAHQQHDRASRGLCVEDGSDGPGQESYLFSELGRLDQQRTVAQRVSRRIRCLRGVCRAGLRVPAPQGPVHRRKQ